MLLLRGEGPQRVKTATESHYPTVYHEVPLNVGSRLPGRFVRGV